MCVCLIKVFIVILSYSLVTLVNIVMGILNLVPDDSKHKIQKFLIENNLLYVYDLDLPNGIKGSEEWREIDLIKLLEYCDSKNIDPTRVLVPENALSVSYNTPLLHIHCPVNCMIIKEFETLPECTPTKHFNYLAGNFHYDRFMLLQELYQKDLLKNTHWSAYRNINLDIFPDHKYTESFIDFCKNNIPRTMKNLEVYNKFPEDLLEPRQYREGSLIMDANNIDAEIFKDSAVTIIVDTLANNIPSLYDSKWQDVEQKLGRNTYYTKKILKPILHKRPFIACIGRGKGINKYLSDMGFQTFESVWDESYFDADTPKERVDRIVNLCYNLSKLEIAEIHDKTREICEHNYDVLTKTDWVEWFLSQIQTTLHIRQATT